MPKTTVRPAKIQDLDVITEIYNQAILTTVATFDTSPKTPETQRDWFLRHNQKYPVWVAQQEGEIVGWASLSQWSDRCAYADTAEISLYVREGHRGKGIGRQLTGAILQAGEENGIHTVIARIVEGNDVSIHMAELFGFQHIGVMKEVGRKFSRLLDVYLMQKIFHPNSGQEKT